MKCLVTLISATLLLEVTRAFSATHYVSQTSTNPTPPYATWDSAATNIQQAVSVATAGDNVVVTNGVYAGQVSVTNPLTLLSVNGPQFTVINGGHTNSCASLTHGASLSGFTLTNGLGFYGGGVSCASSDSFLTNCAIVSNSTYCVFIAYGAGVFGGTLYNCTLSGNSVACSSQGGAGGGAYSSTLYNCTLNGNLAKYGGGASSCTLYNCILSGNSAGDGGGADGCTLYHCTLIGNSSPYYGGGVYNCMLYNCIIQSNTAPSGANYDFNSSNYTLNYCCTTPLPPDGVGNITNAPQFVDSASGNLRLQSNSPCINAGNNAYVSSTSDLDGNPRIVSGTVDIGAYEYQGSGSLVSYAWLAQYGLPSDGSADYADPDGDGMNNWQEWICGTDPTNSLSLLTMLTPSNSLSGISVPWQSVSRKTYILQRTTNLNSPFAPLATNIPGQPGATTFADTNTPGADPIFYRVGVQH